MEKSMADRDVPKTSMVSISQKGQTSQHCLSTKSSWMFVVEKNVPLIADRNAFCLS